MPVPVILFHIPGALRCLARALFPFAGVAAVVLLGACTQQPNDPYPVAEAGRNILYGVFSERPKHLDPVQSFSEDEATFLYQIVEPPLQYHYLKRPYELEPGVAASLPRVRYFDAAGVELGDKPDPGQVARSVFEITLRAGVRFQPHPAFARDAQGAPRYLNMSAQDLAHLRGPLDFAELDSRELVAADYVYQIKRLAHPRLHSPILELMAEYLPGLKTLHETLAQENKKRPAAWLDLDDFPLEGVEVVDRYTYRITLQGIYPQFRYWLTMPFFSAMPREVDRFFAQPGMAEKNFTLDYWPVGTGPYMLAENDPNARMVLRKNPNFRHDTYPCEGEEGDRERGLLADCGKVLPFIDEIVFTREREDIPRWNKFLQGYYDASGISSDNFDQAVSMGGGGEVSLSDEMAARGIRLLTSVSPSVFYMGFNMLDPVVGDVGDAAARERARKLRQAISIVLDMEEFISIFLNGRGIPAMHPVPPGIFGAREGEVGINPVVYTWRDGRAQRRSLDEAKRLLAEAGWPNGRNAQSGEALVIHLDTTSSGLGDKARSDWMTKKFRALGVQFEVRATDWNRFQDKILRGSAQFFFFGWNADYPDPENLLFLLYGPQGKVGAQGQNASNYHNDAYDRLFEQMKVMPDGPARQAVIDRMVAIVQNDAPWVFGFHPLAYSLQHGWIQNRKPGGDIMRNGLKYQRLDIDAREAARRQWNQPVLWPLVLAGMALIIFILPAVRSWQRRERATARSATGLGPGPGGMA
ncbi:peptide ABC transporter substrate-binding protein [Betaproteobacteria bacterium]|nr:peptide ABC transporter substrate-binding protein [Betaproteobacteria bacterium]GHU20291.1 peptide ABC transporter substrate-binding protein [Betaproteobacteria bacterium]